MGIRRDGREPDDLRPIAFTRDFTEFAAGSVLVEFGRTRVLCTASVEERVPPWLRGQGSRLGHRRVLDAARARRRSAVDREAQKGRPSGRTQEIQRLIGRSLRAVTDLQTMGEVQITVDCDVLQADGGTRTASICGGYVALHDACSRLVPRARCPRASGHRPVRARSRSASSTRCRHLDLEYSEDVRAEVDMNVVMTGAGRFVEVQGTAEGEPFSPQRARRAARPRRGRHPRDLRPPTRGAGRATGAAPRVTPVRVRARHREPRQGRARSPRSSHDAGAPVGARARARPTCPRSRRPAPRSRRTRGSRPSRVVRGDRAARDRRRHRARGRRARRRARRVLGPLRRRARRHATPTTATPRCSSASAASPPSGAPRASPPWPLARWPDGARSPRSGHGRGHDHPRARPTGRRRLRLRPGVRARTRATAARSPR